MLTAIAIDGPAGAGKSTIARTLANQLGYTYLDTGAMYRAVTLKAMRESVPLEDEAAMGEVACRSRIDFPSAQTVSLDGEDVTAAIRTPELTRNVRYAARATPVRNELVLQQQQYAAHTPVVMEGRDITTVVLPDARWKFLLTASPEERARRRVQELIASGHDADYEAILKDILERDASDRTVGALKNAEEIAQSVDGDIHLLDTTSLTPAEVVEKILSIVRADRL